LLDQGIYLAIFGGSSGTRTHRPLSSEGPDDAERRTHHKTGECLQHEMTSVRPDRDGRRFDDGDDRSIAHFLNAGLLERLRESREDLLPEAQMPLEPIVLELELGGVLIATVVLQKHLQAVLSRPQIFLSRGYAILKEAALCGSLRLAGFQIERVDEI